MMNFIVRILLRYRLVNLIIIVLLTGFMAYRAFHVELSYQLARMLPSSDSVSINYDNFRTKFGEDGNVFVIGVTDERMFEYKHFVDWYEIANQVKKLEGIEEVVTITRIMNITKNDSIKKFEFAKVVRHKPGSQAEVDSLKKLIFSLPFYRGFLYNAKTNAYLLAITLDKKKLDDKSRFQLIKDIKLIVQPYCAKYNVGSHYSGLPYIRTIITEKVKSELVLFIILSLIISAIILIIFFNSLNILLASMTIVGFSIAWSLGTISLLGYKMTILTAVLPSLLIMIAIENCIYLLNKYHLEYKTHQNKVKALSRVIKRMGFTTLMTNVTTATGFATFIFTSNVILREFGVIASLNIIIEFLLSFILIPIIFSYLPPPKAKHIRYLENNVIRRIINQIVHIILYQRKTVYIAGGVIVVGCIYGIMLMQTSGRIVEDLPKTDPVYTDLKYFESNFGGVMPFEFSIDTKKKNGVMRLSNIAKIDQLQKEIAKYPDFSKPLSLAEIIKYSRQAFYNGKTEKYKLPDNMEKDFILAYFPSKIAKSKNIARSFIDSNKQVTRISVQVADVGLDRLNYLQKSLKPGIDSIFSPKDYKVLMTGNSIVYAKGTQFLIRNLLESVLFGVLMISIIMILVFASTHMILIAMIVNVIPLLITAAIMGFSGIAVKPSTLIVFSIALGISIDNAILYLTKYRYDLRFTDGNIKESAINALKESGISMIYTAVVFIFGFGIFVFSGFGGTKALGLLISITLMVALFFNILVLPTLLLTINKIKRIRNLKKPYLDISIPIDVDD